MIVLHTKKLTTTVPHPPELLDSVDVELLRGVLREHCVRMADRMEREHFAKLAGGEKLPSGTLSHAAEHVPQYGIVPSSILGDSTW